MPRVHWPSARRERRHAGCLPHRRHFPLPIFNQTSHCVSHYLVFVDVTFIVVVVVVVVVVIVVVVIVGLDDVVAFYVCS